MSALAAEMQSIDLGDARRNRRAQQVLGQLGYKPRESIPSACGGWTEARAAYLWVPKTNRWSDHGHVDTLGPGQPTGR